MTYTDIANLALSKIGESMIDDITDTGDRCARLANLHIVQVEREILRAHFWGFSMVSVKADALDPIDYEPEAIMPFSAAFPIPSDFVKLRCLYDTAGNKIDKFDFRYVNLQRCIVAGAYDSIVFEYARFSNDGLDYDVNFYDSLFIAAFSTLLASRLARAISGSDSLESQLLQRYETIDLPAARCADGHDSQSGENHPLREMLDGALVGQRGDFFPDLD